MYESIRDFVDAYTQKRYVSKHGKNLNIMQCVDLSVSSDLSSVISKTANNASL